MLEVFSSRNNFLKRGSISYKHYPNVYIPWRNTTVEQNELEKTTWIEWIEVQEEQKGSQ